MDMDEETKETEQMNEEQPMPSSETENAIPADIDIEPPSKPLHVIGSKKLIDFLLKKKILLVIVIGTILLLLVGFMIALFSESTESTHFRYKENTTCDNVTVVYDPYGPRESRTTQMSLETYVRGAIEAYLETMDHPSTDMYNFYYALSVILRTEAISNGCKVTYHDKQISTTSTPNSVLDTVMKLSEGIIMVDEKDDLVTTHVSDFCWETQDEENYTLYQASHLPVLSSFVQENLTNSTYQNCPCNNPDHIPPPDPESDEEGEYDKCFIGWDTDDDEIDDEFEWIHQDDEEGFSVFGAYYVYRNTGKDYFSLLKYFYGNINLMTTKKEKVKDSTLADHSSSCSQFSLTSTTLSKSEFVNKVKNYAVSSEPDWALFQEHAGEIYDIARANQANPEMIVVRAILEGFSPGGSTHNYFGITCYNGQPEKCSKYDTFDQGILGFITTIKKYESYLELTKKYAYLGDYWYNPGSWADGGCAYAESIYPNGLDSYVLDACSSARRNLCEAKGTKSGCVATRQEDKDAYALYQGQNMIRMRERVFGISSNSCTNESLNYGQCVIFNQSDSRWSNDQLGFGNRTLGNAGCAVTSVAIALTCTGQVKDSSFSPQVLNEKLKEMNGFSYGAIVWNNNAMREFVPSFQLGNMYDIDAHDSASSKIEILKKGLEPNQIGIVHLNSSTDGHFVVLKDIDEENETISVLDPAGGKINTYSLRNVDGFKYYRY